MSIDTAWGLAQRQFPGSRRSINVQRGRTGEEQGFTLIELLIVIMVLGVLAGIVIFALGGTTAQAAVAACNADAHTVETAVSAYDTVTGGTTPATATLLTTASPQNGNLVYLHSMPNSPDYAITLVSGTVMIAAPPSASPVAYGTDGACANAGASAATTTTAPAPPDDHDDGPASHHDHHDGPALERRRGDAEHEHVRRIRRSGHSHRQQHEGNDRPDHHHQGGADHRRDPQRRLQQLPGGNRDNDVRHERGRDPHVHLRPELGSEHSCRQPERLVRGPIRRNGISPGPDR